MNTTLFIPGKGPLYQYDPRAKLLTLLYGTAYFFFPIELYWLGISCMTIILVACWHVGTKNSFIPLRSIAPVLLLVLLLTPPFYRTGDSLASFQGFILLTSDGVITTVQLLCRFIGLTYLYYLFFSTTTIQQVILSLQWFRLPYTGALVITLSFRFIPYIGDLYHAICDAHSLRGSAVQKKSGFRLFQIKSQLPILTSVIISSIKTIPNLAMSLEHRGIGRKNQRTCYKELEQSGKLFTHLVFFAIIAVILSLPLII